MAIPSSNEIAKLVDEIRDLKNSLDESAVDRAEIAKRYDAALQGLLIGGGEFDSAAWDQLSDADRATRAATLASLKQNLLNAIAAAPVVRVEPGSFMYKKPASNAAILFLTVFALAGLLGDLWLICHNWNRATSGKTVVERPAQSAAVAPPSTSSPGPAQTPSSNTTELTGPDKPTEQTVLYMVMLLGGLGGFLRLASSMANYVGNRQLVRSWIIYYVLTPFQGAALAPVVYLLLRVGVLNPANTTPGTSSPTDSLNLIGIYAFAALTGLFSKQAIEMMAEVFSTIFKKVNAKDALEKSKPETPTNKTESADAS
jgi:hypothetical protein